MLHVVNKKIKREKRTLEASLRSPPPAHKIIIIKLREIRMSGGQKHAHFCAKKERAASVSYISLSLRSVPSGAGRTDRQKDTPATDTQMNGF